MPAKKKGGGNASGGGTWQKDEDELQAIIVADSFNRRFAPISHELPRALFPLGNKVLIDYTIEYLLAQGVQEIIVFCCSLGEKVRDYVIKKWVQLGNSCNIQCVLSSTADCISLGDALREIDREGLIRSDFILVPGDLLSNVQLQNIMKEHKAKRKKEKNLVMTLIHRVLKPGHFCRCPEDDVFMAVERETNRILYCHNSQGYKKFSFPTSILSHRKEVTMRYDLSSCNIAICSPQVAPLFTDNFDYQNLDDLITGILTNEEILGDQVHTNIITEGYSSRINDLHMYNAVSLDLMNRKIHPLVAETPSCPYKRNNVYYENDVKINKNCKLIQNIMIGKNTCIGEETKISDSIIGSNCNIGKNVHIENSYIWDNVTVEDGVSLVNTVVCSNCILRSSSKSIDGIISFNVCVGCNVELPPSTKLSLLRQNNFETQFDQLNLETPESDADCDIEVVGADGKGFAWLQSSEEDEVIPSLTGNDYETSSDESSEEEDDDDSLPPSPPTETTNLYQFYVEVMENLRCGIIENIAMDNIALEINASKFKFNISIQELCQTVSKALAELSIKDVNRPKQDIAKDLEKTLSSLLPLLQKYFNCPETQLHSITGAEDYFVHHLDLGGVFATYLHKMYDKDILDESVILKWYKTLPVAEEFVMQDSYNQLRENQTLVKLITWLEEADEEDSEEEDSD